MLRRFGNLVWRKSSRDSGRVVVEHALAASRFVVQNPTMIEPVSYGVADPCAKIWVTTVSPVATTGNSEMGTRMNLVLTSI